MAHGKHSETLRLTKSTRLRQPERRSGFRMVKLVVFLALAATVGLALYTVKNPQWVGGRSSTGVYAPSQTASPPESAAHRKSSTVTLFFSDPDSGLLIREERSVVLNSFDTESRIRAVLLELQRGSKHNLLNPVPALSQLRGVSLKGDTAVLDYSRELQEQHPGGSLAEMHTIYAIVNSVALNIASVRNVQILIEGNTVETLKGHIDCRSPLAPNLSLIKAS